MHRSNRMLKALSVVVLSLFVQSLILPSLADAQAPCTYDKTKPTISSARYNFKITNYACAEQELQDLLAIDTLDMETRAAAHVLLAEVYYAKVRNEDEKKTRVMEQFVKAFESYLEWRGEVNIQSPEFLEMMEQAKAKVEAEQQQAAAEEEQEPAPPVLAQRESEKGGSPWYKKWYVWGIGAAVVAGVAVAAGGGGGDDDGGGDGPLPGFPPPPAKR